MKKLLCALLLCAFAFSANAAEPLDDFGYVFPEFASGIIQQRNGPPLNARLNYDMVGEQMAFTVDGQYFTLLPQEIAAVFVARRKFLPAPGNSKSTAFLEEVPLQNGEFYVRRKMALRNKGKGIGYGMYSETTATHTVGSYVHMGGELYGGGIGTTRQLAPSVKQEYVNANIYYVSINGKYRPVSNVGGVTRLFKSHKAEIRKFVDDNGLKFDSEENIAAILNYAFGLK